MYTIKVSSADKWRPDYYVDRKQFKCSSIPNIGSIRRTKHITQRNSNVSRCKVFGDGLKQASVGSEASFTIKVDSSSKKKLHSKIFFSSLAVGRQHIFAIPPSSVLNDTLEIHFSYTPTLPGNFDLYVEEITSSSQKQLPGSPFELFIAGPTVNENQRRKETDKLPSCQTIPQYDPSWSEGEWVTRDLAGNERGTLRSGWVLQPKRCSFDIFTTDDLVRASLEPTPKTIAVIGRSTERGIFLSLVDLALKKEEKSNLDYSSVFWKCWGLEEFRVGSLRFFYQDFRIEAAKMPHVINGRIVNITCHNKKTATAKHDFFGDGIGFFQQSLFTERFRPDIIIMIITNTLHLQLLVKTIPPSWNGTFYALNGFKSQEGSFYTPEGRQADIEMAKSFPIFDKRIRTLDGFALGTPWRHTTESAPLAMKSYHWHKPCDNTDENVRVCGDPTEMIAQIMLGKLLAPQGKVAWLATLKNCQPFDRILTRDINICYECPATIGPWHINRVPHLECKTGKGFLPGLDQSDMRVWKGNLCPKDCMKTDPISKINGQTEVRVCTILEV
ncbi:uncharacterized protein [Apostichopus japonicus]|uniref:uncharacterized protein isoform X2 n=1 Tax=Stichopus japonicus TaxID=307972 RepID=UPI003AB2C9B1